jgi:hypothetical protein
LKAKAGNRQHAVSMGIVVANTVIFCEISMPVHASGLDTEPASVHSQSRMFFLLLLNPLPLFMFRSFPRVVDFSNHLKQSCESPAPP